MSIPPHELRLPCEELMLQVQLLHQNGFSNAKQCIASLHVLQGVLREITPGAMQRWLEYISIPLLLLLPADAAKSSLVPERIREECFICLEILVCNLPHIFAVRRVDLYFPVYLRVLAALTDMEKDGQLHRELKEETKMQALRLLHALFSIPPPKNNNGEQIIEFNNSLTLHSCALLLDLSSKQTERFSDIRISALETFAALLNNETLTSTQDVEFIFPGASSSLCESSQMDFKSTQLVVLHAIKTLTLLCSKLGELDAVVDNLFPLLIRIWKESGQAANSSVKLARTELAAYVLLHTQSQVPLAAGGEKEEDRRNQLLRHILLACAELEEEEGEVKTALALRHEFARVSHLCNPGRMLIDSLCTRLGGGGGNFALSNVEIQNELSISGFLLENAIGNSTAAAAALIKLEMHFTELQWSLLFAFACNDSRSEQSGRVEFFRLSNLRRASVIFPRFARFAPTLANRLFDSLLDAVALSLRSNDDNDNMAKYEEEDGMLQLPPSQLPPALYILSQLQAGEQLLLALIELEPLWYDETVDALVRMAALDCVTQCSASVPLLLVDVLYPVLHCLGDEHAGVRIAAERCLSALARECKFDSVASLLQGNVDYVVDGLVRRLPQLLPGDVRFSNVLTALVERIPVWEASEQEQEQNPSPWVDDLVHTILQGLDNRTNTPQVVWSLLRIAQVLVHRANEVSKQNQALKNVSLPATPKSHDDYVDECIKELSEWLHPPPPPLDSKPVEEKEEEEEEAEEVVEQEGRLEPFESVLDKCVLFFSDHDVLVRQQAFKVASFCITALGERSQSHARQAVHRIWPSLVEQLQEERNAEMISLLLDALLLVSSDAAGEGFFAKRFAEEAWPVLESILHRATTTGKPRSAAFARGNASQLHRNIQLAKRVLLILPQLPNAMLNGPHAERIAAATLPCFTMHTELAREALQVWLALARCAGDYIWLPVAAAMGQLPATTTTTLATSVTPLPDREAASAIWDALQQHG